MSKLLEMRNKLLQVWGNLSKNKKVAYSILACVIIIALSSFLVAATKAKYDVLFSSMTPEDSGAIIAKLKKEKSCI